MPKRVPLQSITLTREEDGKPVRVTPEIGKPFDFTAEEIKHLAKQAPTALSDKAVVSLTDDGKAAETDDDKDVDPKVVNKTEGKTVKTTAGKGGDKNDQL